MASPSMKLTGTAEMTAAPAEMRTTEACATTVESATTTTTKMTATASTATHMNAAAPATTRTRIGLNRQCRQEGKRHDSDLKKMSHGLRASHPNNHVQAY